MALRKIIFIILLAMGWITYSQSLAQIGFVIKKAIPEIENIAVIFDQSAQEKITKEAQMAILVTKTKFSLYVVRNKSDIPQIISAVENQKKPAVIVIADTNVLNSETIKYSAHKLSSSNTPVISTRGGDTKAGALLCVIQKDNAIETHVNKAVASALSISFPEEFLTGSVIDIQ